MVMALMVMMVTVPFLLLSLPASPTQVAECAAASLNASRRRGYPSIGPVAPGAAGPMEIQGKTVFSYSSYPSYVVFVVFSQSPYSLRTVSVQSPL